MQNIVQRLYDLIVNLEKFALVFLPLLPELFLTRCAECKAVIYLYFVTSSGHDSDRSASKYLPYVPHFV